jgi:sulfur-oxidizing protein SoxY
MRPILRTTATSVRRPPVRPHTLPCWLTLLALALPLPSWSADDLAWTRVRKAVFGERPLVEDPSVLALEAPERAEDASMVPVALRVGPRGTVLRTLWLVVDDNPSPLAARFTLHDAVLGSIETRIRVERYTHVRAVGETGDGHLFMATRFVRAAGGCSAPAGPGGDDGDALGRMSMRRFGTASGGRAETELRIRHPNHSGLEIDLDSRGYIAADYVRTVTVRQDGQPLLDAELDISISRNPYLRFGVSAGAQTLDARMLDSRGREFSARWPPDAPRPP